MNKPRSQLADAPWPKRKEPAPKRKNTPPKRLKLPDGHRLDTKFNEWAKRNNVDLKNIPMMKGNRK